MRQSETITKIAAALVKAQASMGPAIKDSKNPFFKSNYADINAINDVLLPALHAHGISALQPPTTENGKNYIETVLLHESGEFLTSLNEVIVAKQNDPQSYLAAQTYTRRGALQAFLNIGAEDDDGNTASGKTAPTSIKESQKEAQQAAATPNKTPGPALPPKAAEASGAKVGGITGGSKSFRKPKAAQEEL